MNSIERHIRWLVDSDYAFIKPKAGSQAANSNAVATTTPQRLAIEEANQILNLVERQLAANGPPPGVSGASPLPSPPRSPPEDAVLAKAYPHHVRYFAAACRSPPTKALFYLEQARDAGSRLAAAEAGQMYVLGIGTKADIPRGLQLLDSACGEGHPGAMLMVGRCLRDGLGVPIDVTTAVVWMTRAASLRYVPAAHELGEIYESGLLQSGKPAASSLSGTDGNSDSEGSDAVAVERDVVMAYRYYKLAADADHAPSQLNLAKLFLLGASLKLDETPSESSTKARYWLERSAANGSLEAKALLQRHKHEDPEKPPQAAASAKPATGGAV